ncbi:MAG: HtrA protease/chaperone protein / Serine protease (Protease DO) (EC [uncultured Thiotrichaceae bacterium]|uniref:HtrA protease/chaperone protein / Serine protease (Protease DO) (EC) n=1 Tax=uncultured Thiotrichaceae bacterium TaxID=298394 RepID=A0A6S6TRG7_9GAMM|nr:MAG: HtrA protease/chaperone protein / Serine protease (Protease DO) (EC [uncultured Thiotrichaceae bacterium]
MMRSAMTKKLLLAALLVLTVQGSACAGALPSNVGGQPLPSLSPMLERVTPAVVNITTEGKQKLDDSLANDPFFKRFFDNVQGERRIDGTGSGVIIHSKHGHILTNYHVLEGAERINVTLNDGRKFVARVVGADPKADLAVIAIPAERLSAIRFGNSKHLRVGDFVVAIGNPYGIGQSVTSGIISALHRNPGIGEYEDFIQTDASINLGNSGGALINLRGELIGINTAILGGQSGGNIGIGFAIPINTAAGIIDQIVRFGQVERGILGIEVGNVDPQTARASGLAAHAGALIERVFPASSADLAGLQAGDIIIRLNNSEVSGASDVKSLIGSMRAGSKLGIVYLRAGRTRTAHTSIGESIPIPSPATEAKPFWESN